MTLRPWIALMLAAAASLAQADAVDTLREFVRDVKSGQASFTQTVVSTDGARKKTSSGQFEFARPVTAVDSGRHKVSRGHFEFLRPNRFRFVYTKPFEQTIVADGQKVWIYDADLNQASSRAIGQALGATPAALLAGGSLDAEFALAPLPARDGLDWALATPKAKDGPFQSMRVGFRGKELAAVEITDSFGQVSRLQFTQYQANTPVVAERFRFVPPFGADVIEQ